MECATSFPAFLMAFIGTPNALVQAYAIALAGLGMGTVIGLGVGAKQSYSFFQSSTVDTQIQSVASAVKENSKQKSVDEVTGNKDPGVSSVIK